jgi:hypothetical protein
MASEERWARNKEAMCGSNRRCYLCWSLSDRLAKCNLYADVEDTDD